MQEGGGGGMADMMKQMGGMGDLMKNIQKAQQLVQVEAAKVQEELARWGQLWNHGVSVAAHMVAAHMVAAFVKVAHAVWITLLIPGVNYTGLSLTGTLRTRACGLLCPATRSPRAWTSRRPP